MANEQSSSEAKAEALGAELAACVLGGGAAWLLVAKLPGPGWFVWPVGVLVGLWVLGASLEGEKAKSSPAQPEVEPSPARPAAEPTNNPRKQTSEVKAKPALPKASPRPTPEVLLGVSAKYSAEELKSAYHARLSQSHPDKHATASKKVRRKAHEKTIQIIAAYETLKPRANRGPARRSQR